MPKKYRDIINPITPRDWFLYYLFTDEDFVSIRKQWRVEIDDIESGEPGREGIPFLEQEKITKRYVNLLSKKFRLNEDVAIKGLAYTEWSRALNEDRIPTAKIDGDRVTISVGVDTRLEDVEHLWNIYVTSLQEKILGRKPGRAVPANEPLLAYVIHKNLLKGRELTKVHKEYLDGSLDSRILPGERYDLNDFRKYYKRTVKGYIKTP